MRDVTSAGQGPSRRLAVAGVLGAGVALLAGCGIRLEDDAPRVPLVPARSPIDGEDALVRLLAALQSGALAPVYPSVAVSALLPALHARQATVVHDALRKRGVPADELPSATASPSSTGTPQTSPTASPSASPTVPVTKVTVAVTENAILTAGGALAAAEADLRPMLLATLAQAHAALDLAGAGPASTAGPTATTATPTPTPTPTKAPASGWDRPEVVAPLVTAARTATYFLQVAAARSPKSVRSAWLVDLDGLHAITGEMVGAAGSSAPAPVLGLPLPHPVTTPTEAATLATEALSTLLTSFGAQLATLCEGDADAAAAFDVVPRWLGTVAAQAHRHGVPLGPFPGLT